MARHIALVVLVALFAAACGGGENRATTIEPTGSPAAEATDSTTAPEEVEKTTTAAETEMETEQAANSPDELLLMLGDMPTGWTTAPEMVTGDDDGGATGFCGEPPIDEQFEPSAEAEAAFKKDDFGPFVNHAVATYESREAEQAMDAALEAAQSCQEWTETEDGEETTFTLQPVSFPTVGDQTVAFRINAESQDFTFTGDVVFWRRGDLISLFSHLAFQGGLDSDLTEELVMAADDKL